MAPTPEVVVLSEALRAPRVAVILQAAVILEAAVMHRALVVPQVQLIPVTVRQAWAAVNQSTLAPHMAQAASGFPVYSFLEHWQVSMAEGS